MGRVGKLVYPASVGEHWARKRQEAVGIRVFYRIRVGFHRIATGFYRITAAGNRLLPHITASYRIKFCWEMEWWSIGGMEWEEAVGTKLCGFSREKVRVVTRKCAKVRTEQARKSAMLRIVTGKAHFSASEAGSHGVLPAERRPLEMKISDG